MQQAINLREKCSLINELWSPRVVAELNDYQFKIANIEGDFVWHSHPETDEAFIVIAGELTIELRDRSVNLKAGEMFVVPKGVEHKPKADSVCSILMVEPKGTTNTGDAGGERTKNNDVWI